MVHGDGKGVQAWEAELSTLPKVTFGPTVFVVSFSCARPEMKSSDLTFFMFLHAKPLCD